MLSSEVFTYLNGVCYTREEVIEAIENATRIIGRESMKKLVDLSGVSTFELVEELNKRREHEVNEHVANIQKSIEILKRLGVNVCDSDYDPAHLAFEYDSATNYLVVDINID